MLFVRGRWITGVYIFYHFEIMKRLATELHEKKIHKKNLKTNEITKRTSKMFQ